MSRLFQMEFEKTVIKKCFGLRVSGKSVCVCYPYGYNTWQLYDTFLAPSLCNCYKRYDKQGCILNPPHTLELYYRVQEALDITVVYTISVQKKPTISAPQWTAAWTELHTSTQTAPLLPLGRDVRLPQLRQSDVTKERHLSPQQGGMFTVCFWGEWPKWKFSL